MALYTQHQTLTVEQSDLMVMTWTDGQTQGCPQCPAYKDVLTAQEIRAARTATYFDTSLWGTPEQGWTPEAMVAQVRGVVFQRDAYGFYGPDDLQTAQQALEDVATGLGFDDIDAYLNAVMTEQEVIVARLNRLLL
ncbi:MAG TPA: hypothetical protein VIH59_02785 [Candidatus Tectomicrobia bacterium]|jgi:hypothetical protein